MLLHVDYQVYIHQRMQPLQDEIGLLLDSKL